MYKIEYLESVIEKDIPKISKTDQLSIRMAIEKKLQLDPVSFGKPLRYSLKGCRRLRVGKYRIIYKLEGKVVLIIKIGHRSEVYEE